MAIIEVYSGSYCPYCERAKGLLKKLDLAYQEYDVKADPSKRDEMLQRANGQRTIPQIFINQRHVGGCDDLFALHRSDELNDWLG